MTLTYGFSTPRDLLEKARRDLLKLDAAAQTDDTQAVGDALFDFAVTTFHVKDWLKEQPGAPFQPQDVEDYVASNAAISSFHDLCTAGKHRVISRYQPSTVEVLASAGPATDIAAHFADGARSNRDLNRVVIRRKVILTDGSRNEVVRLARSAIEAWDAFFRQHGL